MQLALFEVEKVQIEVILQSCFDHEIMVYTFQRNTNQPKNIHNVWEQNKNDSSHGIVASTCDNCCLFPSTDLVVTPSK